MDHPAEVYRDAFEKARQRRALQIQGLNPTEAHRLPHGNFQRRAKAAISMADHMLQQAYTMARSIPSDYYTRLAYSHSPGDANRVLSTQNIYGN